jgi:predicted Zn-dependent protease
MRGAAWRVAVLLLLTGAGAAGAAPAWAGDDAVRRFVAGHGGEVAGDARARVERVGETLRTTPGLGGLRFAVLADDTPGAWAWPTGDVQVSRGLLALADDTALLAALAHEAAHLVTGGHLGGVAGLGDAAPGADRERRADALACALLRARGLPTSGMPDVLARLAAAAGDAPARRALAARALEARRRCAPGD